MDAQTKHILISAGEASGDMHAANLVAEVTKIAPNIKFYGMGSNLMQQAGVNIIINSNSLSVFGGLEIITKFCKILTAFRTMKSLLFRNKPDLLILVDYPGFNLRLAKAAKSAGVKVIYYISPKVWAWHQSRVKIIKKYVDVMAVIFPFEVEFYKKWRVPVVFVGNPLLKTIAKVKLSKMQARQLLELEPKNRIIGLFPGSRIGEIKRLLPIMLDAAKKLIEHNPEIQFVLSQAHTITNSDLQPYLQSCPTIKVRVIAGKNYEVMQACDAIISASGTATLEITLLETPLVIIYKMSAFEYQIAKRLIKIPYVGLCNILAKKKIVPELLQNNATSEKIAQEIEKILNDELYRNMMILNLQNIRKLLEDGRQEVLSSLIIK